MEAVFATLFLIFCASEARFLNDSSGIAGTGCTVNGTEYRPGDSYPSPDGCNMCTCMGNNTAACTLMMCPGCYINGTHYNVGDSVPSPDGCNMCTCMSFGRLACTLMACPPPGCTINGTFYGVGESFPSPDGCNMCTCQGRDMAACTLIACPAVQPKRCFRPCPRHRHPVCGSNGRTYRNGCFFETFQCLNPGLSLAHLGPCLPPV